MTEEQIREILRSRHLTHKAMGERVGKSYSTIQRIRAGGLYRGVAPELPRWNQPEAVTCQSCCYWRNGACSMHVPDVEIEGVGYAIDCDLYATKSSKGNAGSRSTPSLARRPSA